MEHRFKPTRYYTTYGPNEPAYRVKTGDSVVTTTVDAGGTDESGKPLPEEARQRSSETILSPSNPLVGPFYVEGAEVGDTLAVRVEGITLNRPSAWSRIP